MSRGFGTGCNKIRRIVTVRRMLRRWCDKARASSSAPPSDVPAGHVAVIVGWERRRYSVPATHLNHPIFKRLLALAEEEYGFANEGPLAIPCDEGLFDEVLRHVSRSEAGTFPTSLCPDGEFPRHCHVGIRAAGPLDFLSESRPLLNGVAD